VARTAANTDNPTDTNLLHLLSWQCHRKLSADKVLTKFPQSSSECESSSIVFSFQISFQSLKQEPNLVTSHISLHQSLACLHHLKEPFHSLLKSTTSSMCFLCPFMTSSSSSKIYSISFS